MRSKRCRGSSSFTVRPSWKAYLGEARFIPADFFECARNIRPAAAIWQARARIRAHLEKNMHTFDRREFLRLTGLGGAVFMSGLSGCAATADGKSAQDDFYFVQLSDTHW